MIGLVALLRYVVLAAAAAVVFGAFAAMAVQARTINPFGRAARAIRAATDPLLLPIERRILRSGGNPQSAPWWLVGIGIVGGITLVTAVQWTASQAQSLAVAASFGPRYAFQLAVYWAFNLVILALVVRIIGSWIGASRSITPPWGFFLGLGRVWRLAMLSRSMTTRRFSLSTRSTLPALPDSLPLMTMTWSPLWIFITDIV